MIFPPVKIDGIAYAAELTPDEQREQDRNNATLAGAVRTAKAQIAAINRSTPAVTGGMVEIGALAERLYNALNPNPLCAFAELFYDHPDRIAFLAAATRFRGQRLASPSTPVEAQCEDCVEDKCICDPWLNWITRTVRAGRGEVRFGVTENGNVGVWWYGAEYKECSAFGDTAEEAIRHAAGQCIRAESAAMASQLSALEHAKHVPESILNMRIDI